MPTPPLIVPFGGGHKVPEEYRTPGLLGGKGLGLVQMAAEGLPVPPGFVITTEAWHQWRHDELSALDFENAVTHAATDLGGALLSVRSGAPVSMPGMMDTVLNVGLTKDNWKAHEARLGEVAVRDCWRRFLQMYGEVVREMPSRKFEAYLAKKREEAGVETDADIGRKALGQVCLYFRKLHELAGHAPWPSLEHQLSSSVYAVFRSWTGARAVEYRKLHGIAENMGTACVVQRMVFGNLNDRSCSGVMFTRDPATGARGAVGEFAIRAQGEDVVSGRRTPLPLHAMIQEGLWGALRHELGMLGNKLETTRRDAQDVEFTVEDGKLWALQTRAAKRTGMAAFRIAADMLDEGLIGEGDLPGRVTYRQWVEATTSRVDPGFSVPPLAEGLPASPGVVTGTAALSESDVEALTAKGRRAVFVARDTSPDDIKAMAASAGFVTATGGITCHAAVVARGMGKVAVVGVGEDALGLIESGAEVTVDGATGRVWSGVEVPVVDGTADPAVRRVVRSLTRAWDVVLDRDAVLEGADPATLPDRVVLSLADLWSCGTPSEVVEERVVALTAAGRDVLLDMRMHAARREDDLDLWNLAEDDLAAWSRFHAYCATVAADVGHEGSEADLSRVRVIAPSVVALGPLAGRAVTWAAGIPELLAGGEVALPDNFADLVGGQEVLDSLIELMADADRPLTLTGVERVTEAGALRAALAGEE